MDGSIHAKAQADLAFLLSVIPEAEASGRVNLQIPGPFSRFERALAYYLAKERFTGRGHFIELGSFLGASTQAFAAGLKENSVAPEDRKVIDAYDLFQFVGNWDTTYQNKMLSDSEKSNFLRKFFGNIAGFERYIRVHQGDILQATAPADGRSIEILFVDLCKTEQIMLHVAETFFPKLAVGSRYIQQDYLFGGLPFIKAFHEVIWDYFEVEFVSPPTLAFRLVKPFDLGAERLQRYRDLPRSEKLALIEVNGARFGQPYEEAFRKSGELRNHGGWWPEAAAPRS